MNEQGGVPNVGGTNGKEPQVLDQEEVVPHPDKEVGGEHLVGTRCKLTAISQTNGGEGPRPRGNWGPSRWRTPPSSMGVASSRRPTRGTSRRRPRWLNTTTPAPKGKGKLD